MLSFRAWMSKVDEILSDRIGLTSSCLADAPYASWYEDGLSPLEAAQEAANNEWGSHAPNLMSIKEEYDDGDHS